jgi:hypothetical protein
MAEVTVRKQVAEMLQTTARARGMAISELIEKAVKFYLATGSVTQDQEEAPSETNDQWEQQADKIAQEQAAYEAQHATLYRKFAGQFVAIHDGAVVDYDADRVTLSRRVRAKFGKQPILITPVLAKPQRIFRLSRPHLIKR